MGTQKHLNATSSGRAYAARRSQRSTINVNTLEEGAYWLYWGTEDGNADESKEPVCVGTCSAQEFDAVLSSWVDLYDPDNATEEERADAEKYDIFDRANWPLGHRLFALQQCVTQLDYFPLVESSSEEEEEQRAEPEAATV